jgi:acyl-homoserine-lactone acylase
VLIILNVATPLRSGERPSETGAGQAHVGTQRPADGTGIGRGTVGVTGKAPEAEILWDLWGTPHIFAGSEEPAFRAFGWAQAKSHPELLFRLFWRARGRASEYFGERDLPSDRAVRLMGLYELAGSWYREQSPQFRANLDAFASGINAFAKDNPDQLNDEAKAILPVSGVDVVAHTTRVMYFFLNVTSGLALTLPDGVGSNGWAIAPSHTEGRHALLLANPHLPWSNELTFYEAQVKAPGYDAYGATLVGFPVLAIAFNDHLGWTHTVNTIDAGDLYELKLEGNGYRFGGRLCQFDVESSSVRVKQADRTLKDVTIVVRRSVHGPVLEKSGKTYALRVAGIQAASFPGLLEQWWEMGRARDLAEFRLALGRQQLPMFNVIYADDAGHIMELFNGFVPVRPSGDSIFWSQPIPGDDPKLLWTGIHKLDDLPKAIDPACGWVQNCNDVPWGMTEPRLDPGRYPSYMAPRGIFPLGNLREQRSIRMIKADPKISLDELVTYKNSTRSELADRILDELVDASARHGDAMARKAAEQLRRWDRETNAESQGAVLFASWAMEVLPPGDLWKFPFDPERPLETPRGLRNPDSAVRTLGNVARRLEGAFGRLDVPWGEVMRAHRGTIDLPATGGPGALGIFRVLNLVPAQNGRWESIGGDSYIAAVEFSHPTKAKVLLVAGNSTAPDSPHNGDQLALYGRKQMRDACRTRAQVEANLEARTVFTNGVATYSRTGATPRRN